MIKEWHYSKGEGSSVGPVSFEELKAAFMNGDIGTEAYVWRRDFSGWKPIIEIDFGKPPAPLPIEQASKVPVEKLISCPACGNSISLLAAACPRCGRPNVKIKIKTKGAYKRMGCFLLVAALFLSVLFPPLALVFLIIAIVVFVAGSLK